MKMPQTRLITPYQARAYTIILFGYRKLELEHKICAMRDKVVDNPIASCSALERAQVELSAIVDFIDKLQTEQQKSLCASDGQNGYVCA